MEVHVGRLFGRACAGGNAHHIITPSSSSTLAAPPEVIYNDQMTWAQLRASLQDFDNIVISPGPGTPCNPADIGVCLDVLRHATNTPVLGVCLGMQALALVHGGRVERAPEPVHGRLSVIEHTGDDPLFQVCVFFGTWCCCARLLVLSYALLVLFAPR